jgi:hypothetical protein
MTSGITERIIAESELLAFHPGHTLVGEAQALLLQQQSTWELPRTGYKSLDALKVKTFETNGITMRVEFNPGRIRSTTAKVDERSIAERPCFLCNHNLPRDQKALLYRDEYLFLVNPFPILPEHFTIASAEHKPQRIADEFEILLDLASDLAPEYVALYNGPRCGASAPDHLHFQAGSKQYLPLVDEYLNARARFGRLLADRSGCKVYSIDRYLPAFIAFESTSIARMKTCFSALMRCMTQPEGSGEEPMINLLAWYDDGEWRLVVFPRAKHRPDRYFANGSKRRLVSPASIDLGGAAIVPVEEDFERMSVNDLEEIFEEVILGPEAFRDLTGALTDALEA